MRQQRPPLSIATPQSGNHHDAKGIEELFDELCTILMEAGMDLKGVFLNADSGFDAELVKHKCAAYEIEANIDENSRNKIAPEQYRYFDEQLHKGRYVIERMNAWIGSFKALLVRFETKVDSWMALHFLAFSILLIRKINTC